MASRFLCERVRHGKFTDQGYRQRGAADVRSGSGPGGSFFLPRNGTTATKAKAVVDHICYTLPKWDEAKVHAALAANGLTPTGRNGSLHVYNPFDYDIQIGNGIEENAFRR
jgi:hypothetical protein